MISAPSDVSYALYAVQHSRSMLKLLQMNEQHDRKETLTERWYPQPPMVACHLVQLLRGFR